MNTSKPSVVKNEHTHTHTRTPHNAPVVLWPAAADTHAQTCTVAHTIEVEGGLWCMRDVLFAPSAAPLRAYCVQYVRNVCARSMGDWGKLFN